MAIRKRDVKKLVSSFKKEGQLNIFVTGREGIGKTTFANQLLEKICEELNIKININMINFNLKKFIECKYKVRSYPSYSYGLNEFKKKLCKHINIIETYVLKEGFDNSVNIKVFEKGKYILEGVVSKFSKKEVFERETIEKIKRKHIEQIMRGLVNNCHIPIKDKSKYVIFRNIKFYPYVHQEFYSLKKAEKEFTECSNDGGEGKWYLCKILKERTTPERSFSENWFSGLEGSGKTSHLPDIAEARTKFFMNLREKRKKLGKPN